MAQTKVQARVTSPPESQTTMNPPAARAQGRQLASRNPLPWTAGPFGMMRRLSDDMDQLFGQLIGRSGFPLASQVSLAPTVEWMPDVEVFMRDGTLIVQADLPGIAADDVTVEVADGVLTISGERQEEQEVDVDGFRRTERRYGRFSRNIALPEGARVEDIQASCRDGVLEIAIPMAQSTQKRTIDVQDSPGKRPDSGASGTQSGSTSGASSDGNAGKSAEPATH